MGVSPTPGTCRNRVPTAAAAAAAEVIGTQPSLAILFINLDPYLQVIKSLEYKEQRHYHSKAISRMLCMAELPLTKSNMSENL